MEEQQADVLCIQEHRLQEGNVEGIQNDLKEFMPGWTSVFDCSTAAGKLGYSGVGMFFRPGYGRKGGLLCFLRVVHTIPSYSCAQALAMVLVPNPYHDSCT